MATLELKYIHRHHYKSNYPRRQHSKIIEQNTTRIELTKTYTPWQWTRLYNQLNKMMGRIHPDTFKEVPMVKEALGHEAFEAFCRYLLHCRNTLFKQLPHSGPNGDWVRVRVKTDQPALHLRPRPYNTTWIATNEYYKKEVFIHLFEIYEKK